MPLATILLISGTLLAVSLGGWLTLGLCAAAGRGESAYH